MLGPISRGEEEHDIAEVGGEKGRKGGGGKGGGSGEAQPESERTKDRRGDELGECEDWGRAEGNVVEKSDG